MITALLFGATTQAQQIVDFETFGLSPESYDNGSGGGGAFNFNGILFNNIYDDGWGSWDGFAISNVTDNTTAGWGNQYSSFTGAGAGNSSNYAMAYRIPEIDGGSQNIITSFKITNATYTAISMRDGDDYGKQFGSPNNAFGTPDGTNGEDFYRVWIIGSNEAQTQKDSIEFYLADYRFSDNSQDYIVDTWELIDLTGFSFDVSKVNFRFESSDMSGEWLNTPTYFALDDVAYSSSNSINQLDNLTVNVFPNPVLNELKVKGEVGLLRLFDNHGRLIMEKEHNESSLIDFSKFEAGFYFIELSNDKGKSIQRIMK